MTPTPGIMVAQRYELEEPIASGGMGSVWRARHVQLGTSVAVKFMAPRLVDDASAVARFEREARAAALLQSPHVVHVLDYGIESGAPFIAMELLQGEDLGQRLARLGRMDLTTVATIVTHVAKALQLAHRAGVIHRDLKPSNLFMARVGEEEVVKVLDFGIAKIVDAAASTTGDQTTSGMLLGSPAYLSPEQARGGKLDGRSDLWALGAIVFLALTGTKPFSGSTLGDVIAKIIADELPVATDFAPDLPHEVDAFFARAFARNPAVRFPDAATFAQAFREVAGLEEPSSLIALEPSSVGRVEPTLSTKVDALGLEGDAVEQASPGDPDLTAERAVNVAPAPPGRPHRVWLPLMATLAGATLAVGYAATREPPREVTSGALTPTTRAIQSARVEPSRTAGVTSSSADLTGRSAGVAGGASASSPPPPVEPRIQRPGIPPSPVQPDTSTTVAPRPKRCDPFSGLCRNR